VLVLPHHGNWRATLPAFVAAVAPKVVVVSSPDRPAATVKGGKAAEKFYASLGTRNRYYLTCMNGYIKVRFGRGDVTVTSWR
jgi:beta-lactamase superfamily II metal-dependent hydrolase